VLASPEQNKAAHNLAQMALKTNSFFFLETLIE
jgi:hypothetical protein